jgi:flagellar assembly protein FliH
MFSSSRAPGRGTFNGAGGREVAAWRPEALLPEAAPEAPVHGLEDEHGFDLDPADAATAAAETAAIELRMQIDGAYDRGYEDGRAEGRAAEAARLAGSVRAVEEVIARFREESPRWQESLEKNLVALATALAREIVGRELKGSVDDMNSLVQRAVSEFPLTAALRIRLNPADLAALSSPLGGSAVESGRHVRWVPDPEIAPGGCVVEGPESIVDGRVEKALDRIYTKLIYG